MSNYQKSRIKSFLKAVKPKPFHASNLEYIKKITGASFVGYQNYQDLYHLRFVKDGIETFYKLHGSPDDMTSEKYKDLLNLIIFGEKVENKLETDERV
jgi:hypothetical protein